MSRKHLLWPFFFISIICSSQDVEKCSVTVLRKTYDKIDKLKEKDIRHFLCTFDSTCESNIEFSEWSNEILFDVLNAYPREVIEVLEKDKSIINIKKIMKELSTPVTDKVNVHDLINKIDQLKTNKSMKNTVIEFLQKNGY